MKILEQKQLTEAPTLIPGTAKYQHLAYVEAYDGLQRRDYTFVAYKETDCDGSWRVHIRSSQTGVTVFEPALINTQARSTSARGEPWFPWGNDFAPSPRDGRQIQFRVHVANDQPLEIEMLVQLRKVDGSIKTAKSMTFPWPLN
jgi:hypothetical protein